MSDESAERWKGAITNGAVTVVLSVMAGLGLWYAIVETRLAVVEDRSQDNKKTVERIEQDYVRRADIARIEAKLDALVLALTRAR